MPFLQDPLFFVPWPVVKHGGPTTYQENRNAWLSNVFEQHRYFINEEGGHQSCEQGANISLKSKKNLRRTATAMVYRNSNLFFFVGCIIKVFHVGIVV